ncbi:right-handed parallel beta-helix repeat-containing protein [Palleniella muris]|uniref:Right-handed parallel beta-helix repeat-containing protein n=1 Tax=Palleniella muris TaxID=3038145 RepID=A0AC61QQZ0_9BACT|nr:right-handed parallel beta-helix repeat-containing protein [Palleniella muris]TGX82684.1 right-handed parallel beta-helix repeat-containing protein [Palleniella muris]
MKKTFKLYLYLAIALAITACTNDDSFSSSPSNVLTFSKDTVLMDTVFSRVPSSTREFWVFNRSGDGIRCSSIRLQNGNQTGYRVNVNGVYLGESQGYQIFNEEIRKGDSIRVFVELTSPLNNQNKPHLVSDDLVFNLESGVQQKVNLKAWSWDAEMMRDVVISEDYTLGGDKPTVIYGGITVNNGATLTIPAGKTIYFHADAGINVHGRLICSGEQGKEVVLRGDRLDNMFDYLPYDGVSGQWKGITFHEDSEGNILNYTDLHAANTGIECLSDTFRTEYTTTQLAVTNSTIHNCKGYGIYGFNSKITLENTQISNTLYESLATYGGDVDVNFCTIAQFYPFDAARGAALYFSNNTDDVQFPNMHLNVRNSIITGYAEDVIMGDNDDEIGKPYRFTNCLLRTPAIEDEEHFVDNIFEDIEDSDIAGWKNFKTVDTDLLQYNFNLVETSLAIDKASTESPVPTYDRAGNKRDEKPDMGCYEYIAPPTTEE